MERGKEEERFLFSKRFYVQLLFKFCFFFTFLQVCEKDCSIRRLMGLFVIVYNVRVLDAGYRF